MILINNKVSDYRIVISAEADEAVRYAADELAKYLELMGGAKLPVTCDSTETQEKEIVIGKTNREGTPCGSGLKHDGFIWKTLGEKLFILGENSRACLQGVYRLLEDVLGCRFFAKDVEKIPSRNTVVLSELDRTVISPLEYRETFWFDVEYNPDFNVKRGFNSFYYHNQSPRHGGGMQFWGFDHTLFNYVSPDEYFDEHPEYFSMVDGVRIRENTQLCLTNPEVIEITKRKLRQNIIDHPDCRIFSLSQLDWYNFCTCPECARVDEEEGSHAGTMIRFVNAVAADIAEDYPDVIVDTFAYHYTRQAPKITKPLPNVCVRVCSIECCFAHPIEKCEHEYKPAPTRFRDDLQRWSKICNHMYVWDYTTNYRHYLAPFPNFHTLQANMKFFLKNGVKGIFEQGNYHSPSGEFAELRIYLISKLMWDPDIDVEQVMDEFLTGYYGLAAAPIRKYIRMLTDHLVKDNVHMCIFDDPRLYITDEDLAAAALLWDEAEALAADEAELARVRRSRLQVRYCEIQRMPLENPEREKLLDDFERDIQLHGITHIREFRPWQETMEVLRAGGPYL